MSTVLINVGAVSIIWGVLWVMWDTLADAPGWLMALGLISLLVGAALS